MTLKDTEEVVSSLEVDVFCTFLGAVFVRNPLNRELVATFEIIVSVHDNASEVIDKSGSVPNGRLTISHFIVTYLFQAL